MSIRTERVSEEIRKVLSERVVRGLRDPLPGFVTIASVEVTSDFSQAKVWVSVIGTDAQKQGALEVLQHSRGLLRSEVGKKVRLRQTPELHFHLDEAGERASRVWQILDEEKRKAAPAAGAAPPGDEPGPGRGEEPDEGGARRQEKDRG
jgi:ribosome-binding factor A